MRLIHTPKFVVAVSITTVIGASPPGVIAQQLTAADILAPVGSRYEQLILINMVPWDTIVGENVIWDYGWIEVDPTAPDLTTVIIPVEEAPDLATYPEADRVERTIGGMNDDYIIDRFFDVEGGSVKELGSVGPVLSYVFEYPRTVYDLPMAYQDTLHGTYCMWSDGLGVQYHYCGHGLTSFEQQGTLILPGGTYMDVKHVTVWRSSLETTGPSTDSSYTIQRYWYAAGTPFPLLESTMFISSGNGSTSISGRILRQAMFTGLEGSTKPQFSLSPNPVRNEVKIQRNHLEASRIVVRATDGRSTLDALLPPGIEELRLQLGDLPTGVYMLTITSATGSVTQRLLKE